jgi:hypothetical protein
VRVRAKSFVVAVAAEAEDVAAMAKKNLKVMKIILLKLLMRVKLVMAQLISVVVAAEHVVKV